MPEAGKLHADQNGFDEQGAGQEGVHALPILLLPRELEFHGGELAAQERNPQTIAFEGVKDGLNLRNHGIAVFGEFGLGGLLVGHLFGAPALNLGLHLGLRREHDGLNALVDGAQAAAKNPADGQLTGHKDKHSPQNGPIPR